MSDTTSPDASGYGESMGPPDFGTPHSGGSTTGNEPEQDSPDTPDIPGYSVPPAEDPE
ncbi:hypothetical protein [Rhodococcoides corynebacterioides]|uniref:Uncharacterized protein n=1 Tax=Rhodococcoides corynebacterioides TaxID=53972 RepID=A0ABS7P8U3_9NOCA|nr:hypothetical protein [Rhodococcus corynebacterioides]MBY6368765.1 hypothetical protein [Rhodococcus corynebacterioides]MBY6409859.1 hypothetical protein [Rhodococcus corynebacterioides]